MRIDGLILPWHVTVNDAVNLVFLCTNHVRPPSNNHTLAITPENH